MPERSPGEEAAVGHGLVVVDHDRLGHVPALPAGLAGPVGEIDVVAVEPVSLVEAAELGQELAAEEEEGAEQPVGLHGSVRPLVEEVVIALAALRVEHTAQRCPPHEGAAHGREATARRLPAPVGIVHLRADDPRPRVRFGELAQGRDRARSGLDVRVRGDHERRARRGDAAVDVGAEAERPLVVDHARTGRRRRAARIRDEHELVHLRSERLQALSRIRVAGSPDHDCRHTHSSDR